MKKRFCGAFAAVQRGSGATVPILRIELVAALALALVLGCGAKLNPLPPHAGSGYRVGPPDRLIVTILPDPAIEREARVRPDGFISVDMIGDVPAAGRSVEEIAADIQEKMSRYRRDALVTVSLLEALSSSVTLFGEVRDPGSTTVTRDTRIAEAIGMRGGTTIFAAKSRVRVVRPVPGGETEVLGIDLRSIQKGDLSTNIMLQDGDIVVVPPNVLARIGYVVQAMLFPFQPIFSASTTAVAVMSGF